MEFWSPHPELSGSTGLALDRPSSTFPPLCHLDYGQPAYGLAAQMKGQL